MNKNDLLKEINERIFRNLFYSNRLEDSKRILLFLLRGLKEKYALSILLGDRK